MKGLTFLGGSSLIVKLLPSCSAANSAKSGTSAIWHEPPLVVNAAFSLGQSLPVEQVCTVAGTPLGEGSIGFVCAGIVLLSESYSREQLSVTAPPISRSQIRPIDTYSFVLAG
jgi:hypothetical protein